MSRNLLCILLVAAIGFVSADEPDQLVGAENANIGEFPYTVSLRIRNQHFCGGAIVGPRHIITAAHCLQDMNRYLNEMTAVTGTNFLSRGGQSHKVAALYPHPQWGGKRGLAWLNDVGIIKLSGMIIFNQSQRPINLPTTNPTPHTYAVVSAWGNNAAPPRGRISEALQKLFLRIISLQECRQHHGNVIQDSMICTLNEKNIGTCHGDSGSPLVYSNHIIGVVSGGIPCALGIPDVFTNLYSALPFIRAAMGY